MSLKLWFNEVSNTYDGDLYLHRDDRYALLSWCSSDAKMHRFDENRVASLSEFEAILSKPIVIRLNNNPLRAN